MSQEPTPSTQTAPRWVAGSARDSQFFDSALNFLDKANAHLNHAVLAGGVFAICLAARALASSAAGSLPPAPGSPFDIAVSIGIGAGVTWTLAHGLLTIGAKLAARSELAAIGSPIAEIREGVAKLADGSRHGSFAALAATELEKSRASKPKSKGKPGPR